MCGSGESMNGNAPDEGRDQQNPIGLFEGFRQSISRSPLGTDRPTGVRKRGPA